MPRKVDPGTITVGKGLAPEGTVEDTSFRYPERDVDPLRVHIHDPSRAHMASSVGIVDAGDCYVSDEVEGALQEICSGAGAGRLNGLISGGTFNELGNVANGSGSVATTTLTLETTTEIMVGPGVFNASALVASLSGLAAGSYYVYFDTNSSSSSFRTLVVNASVPQVETATGIEHVLLAKFAYDAGGNVTAWQDGRFFVRNLDRKVQYSSRQGENVDAWSEGCFATLQAFFLWMAEYGEGTGTPSEEEKGTVIIRGEHQFPSTLTIPTNHLQFVGDGNAILSTPVAGFTGTRLLDISGRTNITFRNLTFVARTAGLTAIFSSGQALSDIRVEDCTFSNASTQWDRGVDLGNTAATGENVYIKDSTFYIPTNAGGGTTHLGVNLYGIGHARVTGCRFIANGNSDTAGISIGETNHKSANVVVSDCYFGGMALGMKVEFADHVKLVDNTIENTTKGIISEIGTSAPNNNAASTDYLISGNTIGLAPTGFVGISLREVTAATIESNHLACTGSGPFGAVSDLAVGIEFTSVAGAAGLNGVPSDLRITGNNITGFYDSTNNPKPQGFPILVTGEGANNNPVKNVVIADNTINEGGIRIADSVEHFAVTNNILDGLIPGDPTVLSERAILLTSAGSTTPPQNGVISGNIIRRYGNAVHLSSGMKNVDVDQNHISNIAVSGTAFPDNSGFGTTAISLTACEHCSITRNTISGLGTAANNAGTPLVFANSIQCVPIYVRDCAKGIRAEGNTILNSTSQGTGKIFGIVYMITNGQAGAFTSTEHVVADNEIEMIDAGAGAGSFAGVYFNIGDVSAVHEFSNVVVRGNKIRAAGATLKAPSYGFLFQSQVFSTGNVTGAKYNQITVSENTVEAFRLSGVGFDNNAGANQAQPCDLRNIEVSRNHLQSTTPVSGQDQVGVALKVTANAADSFLNGVAITGNKILMPSAPVGGATHYGVYAFSNNTAQTSQFRGLTVVGNLIPTLTQGYGVVAARLGAHSEVRRHDWSVSENRIGLGNNQTGAGLQPQEGITLNLGQVGLHGLRVEGNEVTVDPVTGNARSLYIHTTGTVAAPATTFHMDWLINDNRFAMKGTLLVSARDGSFIDIFDTGVNGIECTGNLFSHRSSTGVGNGLYLRVRNLLTATPLTLRGVTIVGNNVNAGSAGGGLKVDLTGMETKGLTINSNSVGGPTVSTSSLTTLAGAIEVKATKGANNAEMILEDVSVIGNTVVGGPVGIWLDTADVAKQRGIRITENNLSDNPPLNGAATGFSIRYDINGTLAATDAVNICIDDNTSHTSAASYRTRFRFESSPTQVQIRGLSICGNELTGRGGMSIVLTPTSQSRYVNVKVDRNTVTGTLQTEPEYPDQGMIFNWTAPADDTKHIIQNFSFSHNQIDVQGTAAETVRGMWIKFNQLDSFPSFLHGLSVDGNRVQVIRDGLTDPTYVSAIEVEMTCNANNISTSDNIIDYLDEGATSDQRLNQYGLRLYHDFQTGQGVLDTGLGWTNTNSYQIGEFLSNPAIGLARWDFYYNGNTANNLWRAVRWESVRVNSNNIRFSAGATASARTPVAFPDYAALNIGNSQIEATGNDPVTTTFRTVCLWGLTVNGNVLRSCKQNVVSNGGGTLNDLPLVGLVMGVVPATGAWPDGQSAARDPKYTCRGWVISDNSSTDFCRLDPDGGPASSPLYQGFDVRVLFRDNQSHNQWDHSSVKGNLSQDNGQAALTTYLSEDGFDRFDQSGGHTDDNRESDPRTF